MKIPGKLCYAIAAVALAPCIAESSEAMVLTT